MAGELLRLQRRSYELIEALLLRGDERLDEAVEFLSHELCCKLPEGSDRRTVIAMLDRPMRVCGMVRNQGEPGGGPFWVRDERGVEQLQIAESSQIAPRTSV